MSGQPPSQFPPPNELGWMGPPKPKRSEKQIVIIVIVIVVVVVILTVVAAEVLYILTAGLLDGGTGASKPYVTFLAPVKDGFSSNLTANITVAGVSVPISTFSAF
jgi:flagellar basal body-associated protein FliL